MVRIGPVVVGRGHASVRLWPTDVALGWSGVRSLRGEFLGVQFYVDSHRLNRNVSMRISAPRVGRYHW